MDLYELVRSLVEPSHLLVLVATLYTSVAVTGFAIAGLTKRAQHKLRRSGVSQAQPVSELSEEHLRAQEAESEILLRALEVFGTSELALRWLRESNPALNGTTPLRGILTLAGREEVRNILGRIEHGVIS